MVDSITATVAELNYVDGVTSAIQTQLDAKQGADADLTDLADGTLSASKVENAITSAGTDGQVWTSDGEGAGVWEAVPGATLTGLSVTATAAELNILDGVTATATELNLLDGATSLGGASNVNGLSDGLVEDNSIYIGNDPSGTTSTAEYNVAVGATALDAITTGDGLSLIHI